MRNTTGSRPEADILDSILESDANQSVYDIANSFGPAREKSSLSKPFKLEWFGEIRTATPRNQLVQDLIGIAALFLIYGDSNTGKSFFILDLALHIASGFPWRGKRVA